MESLNDIIGVGWAASFVLIIMFATFYTGFYFLGDGDEDDLNILKVVKKLLIISIGFNLFLVYIFQRNL